MQQHSGFNVNQLTICFNPILSETCNAYQYYYNNCYLTIRQYHVVMGAFYLNKFALFKPLLDYKSVFC